MPIATIARAYGPTGHRVIGQIAENHLSPSAKAAVAEILGKETLADVSTWADWIKSDPSWDHAYTWHYVNIGSGETYESSHKNEEGDAVVKLLEYVEVLKSDDATLDKKQIALKWIVHLVGDLHQPLHVGHAEDRGGNSNKVTWFGNSSNLHRVWDSGLIDSTDLSFSEMAESIDRRIDVTVESGPEIDVMLWISEALEVRKKAYEEPEPSFSGSYNYVFDKLGLLEVQLKKAGLRLAKLIEDALGEPEDWSAMPNSVHWIRNSAEYGAVTRQVYRQAANELLKLKETGTLKKAKNWGISIDADETILDNSLFAKERKGARFDTVAWDEWCRRSEAPAVPGAVEFLELVKKMGGKIAVVTNRSIATLKETEENLKQLGIDFDVVLPKEETSSKQGRWELLESGKAKEGLKPMELIMYFGDNIHDFPGMQQDLRDKDEDAYSLFGLKYFAFPNPTYGSFEKNPRK